MSTFKNYEIVEITETLAAIPNQDSLPVKISYRIGNIAKALAAHAEDFNKAKNELLLKYAKKEEDGTPSKPVDKDGKPVEGQILIDNIEELQKELLTLAEDEVSVEIPVLLKLDDLDAAGIRLSPKHAIALEKILEI